MLDQCFVKVDMAQLRPQDKASSTLPRPHLHHGQLLVRSEEMDNRRCTSSYYFHCLNSPTLRGDVPSPLLITHKQCAP
jgi:hypothetical protein